MIALSTEKMLHSVLLRRAIFEFVYKSLAFKKLFVALLFFLGKWISRKYTGLLF
jgi:hypothetical protein